jgi:3-hydroxyisobutyrate dehydrogenase-like beta-hydroxyacid dehydrogenase
MRVDFERTGGFAGMRTTATIDTETLPPDEARALNELVDAAGFFNLPATISSPSPGADRFQYKITIVAGGRQHTVETSDAAVPETLSPLLRKLMVLARSAPGS